MRIQIFIALSLLISLSLAGKTPLCNDREFTDNGGSYCTSCAYGIPDESGKTDCIASDACLFAERKYIDGKYSSNWSCLWAAEGYAQYVVTDKDGKVTNSMEKIKDEDKILGCSAHIVSVDADGTKLSECAGCGPTYKHDIFVEERGEQEIVKLTCVEDVQYENCALSRATPTHDSTQYSCLICKDVNNIPSLRYELDREEVTWKCIPRNDQTMPARSITRYIEYG